MTKFISFTSEINQISLPSKFDYPFNYTPHTLAKTASEEVQEYLKNQTDFFHDFGIKNPNNKNALGKMFGVLVVKNSNDKLGYLTAFSGKLAESTNHKYFVPPVFDVLDKNGFYIKTEEKINQINQQLSKLEKDTKYLKVEKEYLTIKAINSKLLSKEQIKIKSRRKLRKQQKTQNNQLNINEEFYLREYEVYLDSKILSLKNEYSSYQDKIKELKNTRKELSASAQQEIFNHYKFLNAKNETKNILDIFKNSTQNIPAGTGDCCAPKLLQYAFLNNLTPICMAEFWWGKPLNSSVRKHKNYYTACTGKCKPILTHMLSGLLINENPLVKRLQVKKEIQIIFEDDDLLVINKPHELLSVAGKEIDDSVYKRIKTKYPKATGPLIVHRLDMSTSGILLIAKNKETHKNLQAQFINKTVKKRYVALLDGVLQEKEGTVTLPLRVDLNDRPKQLVCNTYGKQAITKWKIIEVKNNKTRVYFYPITGRTHQLRIHASHNLGLNIAIVGDDLYGTESNRLYLHAEKISFIHPSSNKWIEFTCKPPF